MEQNGGSRGAECGVIWVLTRIELRKLRQSPRKVFSRRTALFSVSISEVSSSEASVAAAAALLFLSAHTPHSVPRLAPFLSIRGFDYRGRDVLPPLPPNRTCAINAYGSPVDAFFIETEMLFSLLVEAAVALEVLYV